MAGVVRGYEKLADLPPPATEWSLKAIDERLFASGADGRIYRWDGETQTMMPASHSERRDIESARD